ncbi:MAG: DegT/DnrJ/EryC1/StrS family aminotransferase [Ilumatobacter sp.]|uniref:DegT/DnrJ/EryC1/StrS family aminotransferase n=1 Tax=Ilumatobacter sp. TaxID=1967498 RepID=UPI00391CA658
MTRKLAILGGTPAFEAPLHVGRPSLPDRAALHRSIDQILDRQWITNDGPVVREFEERIAERVGVRHCVATSSGTSAIEILLAADGGTDGYLCPAFTFVATAAAASWIGQDPILVDSSPTSPNISADEAIAECAGRSVSGLLAVHVWGDPVSASEMQRVETEVGCPVMFDAAHAFGVRRKGTPVGREGLASVFSFHATKIVQSIEGGAIVTDDDGLAADLRSLRNFGFSGYDVVDRRGINGKMNEFEAAMGLLSLDQLDRVIDHNHELHEAYGEELLALAGVDLFRHADDVEPTHHYIVAIVDSGTAPLERDQLWLALTAENVLARRYFSPGLHRFADYEGFASRPLPNADRWAAACLALPTGRSVTVEAAHRIGQLVAEIWHEAASLPRHVK